MDKKLTKSDNKMIFGVCAGIAEYFGWDITLTRIIYTILTVCTAFSGTIVYLIMALLMPQKSQN
ncbi:hypothetical protein HW49_02810 [Porphyromonadaceae bacterium COT-184 OH4590]|nr:hypothetical protein HW49_02810 [Porphyromonadaceae bacterium COT-184 OH4590]MDO4727139.1 PspC domain-containing protein [Porphyromonadaceae bacterium]